MATTRFDKVRDEILSLLEYAASLAEKNNFNNLQDLLDDTYDEISSMMERAEDE